jgi:hypothetical protein
MPDEEIVDRAIANAGRVNVLGPADRQVRERRLGLR